VFGTVFETCARVWRGSEIARRIKRRGRMETMLAPDSSSFDLGLILISA
jgi:hypothetical protein